MSINIETVAEKTFNILKGYGYEIRSFNKDGDQVINPKEATRFAVAEPNLLARLDVKEKALMLATSSDLSESPIRDMLKELAQDYLMSFDYKIFDKKIKPKGEKVDIKRNAETDMADVMEELNLLRRLSGLEENTKDPQPEGEDCLDCVKGTADDGTMCKTCDGDGVDHGYAYGTKGDTTKRAQEESSDNQISTDQMKEYPHKVAELKRMFGPVGEELMYATWKLTKEQLGPKANVMSAYNAAMKLANKYNIPNLIGKPVDTSDIGIIGGKVIIRGEGKNDTWNDGLTGAPGEIGTGFESLEIDTSSITEASLGKMTGSRKSSYQPLTDSVKIIVRHNKDVNEEVRGARSRNIHSILIQRGEEKFKMAENNLSAARAMARHLHNGGETFDTIGEAITDMSKEFGKLKEFVNYVRKANLVNEANQEFVTLAMENINNIKTTFKRLSGVKSYANAVESVTDYNNVELLQDDLDLESKFTETHFDDKVANVMDSLKAMTSRRNSFESKITKAIELESFAGLKDMLAEDDLMEFESINQQLGHKVSSLGNTAKDETLGNYLHSISSKLNAGGQLNQFEYGAVKSCLLSAGQHNVQSAPMTASESYEAFMDRFVD